MKLVYVCLLVPAIAAACAGCPTPPAPTPGVPDAAITTTDAAPSLPDASSDLVAACANMKTLGCAEGNDPLCPAVLGHGVDAHITRLDVPCLAGAKSKAEARGCGSVRCL